MKASMEFEKLAVEVSANRAGLAEVRPPVLKGESGVQHRFSLLFSDGSSNYALDLYERVSEVQVVRSYAKKFDTRSSVGIISLGGSVTEAAVALARSYGMRIAGPAEIDSFFTKTSVAHRDRSS